MIEQEITLLTNGRISFQKCGNGLQFGYSKNRGVYSIKVKTSGEWNGLTIRAFWHIPDIKEPITSLLVDNVIRVPALVTSYKGEGRIVFEGSDGVKTVTSADIRYYVNKNSGTCDGTIPEPGTPAWQEFVGTVKKYSDTAVEAKESAKKSADAAKGSEDKAKTSEIISTANTAEVAKNLETVRDIKAEIDILDANVSANAASSNENANNARVSAEAAKQSETNVALSEASALESKNASAENAAKSQNNASNAKNSADSAKESETKAQEYSNLSQSNANASSESASNAKASEDASKKNADDSAATLQELKDGIASGDFKGDKGDPGPAGKDAPQIDDTTVTDSAPWSSKHIVDMLCPPLEETGNPVQCYPVENYPLGVTASWEPTQEGTGDPSPENVRPIKGRDSVTVERCGENLVKYPYSSSSASRNGLVFTSQQDGSIVVNGTATVDTWFPFRLDIEKRLPINTPMTLSGCPAGGSSGSYYIGLYLGGKWFADMGNGNTDVKFTTREIASRVEVSIIKGTVCNNLTFYPKIEVGATITPYSKYTGQTATLTIPETVYGGEVDAVTGKGQETWQAKSFNGTENWALYDDGSSAKFFYTTDYTVDSEPLDTICSHFSKAAFSRGTIIRIYTSVFTDLDAYKDYLAAQYAAGTPVQIAYKLATPEPFTATGAQPISSLSGVNTLLTDADSVTVTGRADPIKHITDLEDAVASMTTT